MSGPAPLREGARPCPSPGPQPTRRRPPPRLRTKTGCLTCRKRRKKCDEQKPCCQTCKRLQLDCLWDAPPQDPACPPQRAPTTASASPRSTPTPAPPTPQQCSALVVARDPPSPPSPPKQVAGLSAFRTTREQSLFHFFFDLVLPSLHRKHADPVYRDQSHLCSIACTRPWVMDALLAMSSHQLSWVQSRNGESAMPYYASAVRSLRENMSALDVADDSLLVTITFLGLYEELRSDKFNQSLIHFNTSSRLLRHRISELSTNQHTTSQSVFLRLHAESAVYHLSTRALFAEQLPDETSWAVLIAYLNMRPAPGASAWAESPLLGSIPRLFSLILESTRLSRSVPLDEARTKKAREFLVEVQESKLRLECNRTQCLAEVQVDDPTLELEVDCVPRLYIIALEIFLLKIITPLDTHAVSPEIQQRVGEAHRLIHTTPFLVVNSKTREGPDPTHPFTEVHCWPLMIIGCASVKDEHIETLKHIFLNLWKCRFSGYVRRVVRVVDAGWSANRRYCSIMNSTPLDEKESPEAMAVKALDGLDTLIQSHGLSRT